MDTSNIVIVAVYVLLAILFFICGKKWSKGKWLNLMAGYNTMSDEEKDKVNIEKTKRVGSILMYISTIWSLFRCALIILHFNNKISELLYAVLSSIATVSFIVLVFVCVFFINKK